MRTQLFKHNKIAYQKVMKAFETSDRTCVVHPTGTGKSYLIAAVSESYQKVLILGPNNFVLDQVHDVLTWRDKAKDVEYTTYQMLAFSDSIKTGYDLICLDEFHRAGAPEWNGAVEEMLDANPQAKVFGTTATHIRYLDDERNMADELFDGNIASHITIAEAWNQSILPIPRYVSGLFQWEKTVEDVMERINRSRKLSAKEKRERIFRLTNAHLHWELSYGMPAILKKHLDRDARRVIVFCSGIEKMEQMREEVIGWFRDAGFTIAGTYLMHSNLRDREQREQMERFEDDTDEAGVKLMFSVNMLNEGIHIPNVNAVLMLRTTASRIIYMQQMGRCLTAANTAKPLVLDMVDNITTTTAITEIAIAFDAIEIPEAEREGRKPRKFEVKDYTLSVRELVEKLAPKAPVRISYEERMERFVSFYKKHGRLPSAVVEADHEEYLNYLLIIKENKKHPDPRFLEIYRKFRPEKESDEQLLQRFLDFVAKNGRLPNFCEKPTLYERNLYYLVRLRLKSHPKVREMWEKYSKSPRIPFEERLQRLVDFANKHHRVPTKQDGKEYRNFWALMGHRKASENETLNRIVAKYGKRFKDIHVKMKVLDFYEKYGRLPGSSNDACPGEDALHQLLWRRRERLYADPDIAPLIEGKVEYVPKNEKIRRVREFCETHDRKPMPEDGRIFRLWEALSAYAKDPRVVAIRKQYATKKMSPEEKILAMQEYTAKHGDRPSYKDHKNYQIWNTMLRLCKDDPRVKEMRKKYAKNITLEDKLIVVNDYIAEHGRCPTKSSDNLYQIWGKLIRENIDDPRVKALYDQYGIKRIPHDEKVRMLQEFTAEHGRCPKPAEGEPYRLWKKLIEYRKDDPRVREMYNKYGGRLGKSMEEKIAIMQQYTSEHGRRPWTKESKMYNIWRHMIFEGKGDARVQEMIEKYGRKNNQ